MGSLSLLQEIFLHPRMEPRSPALQADSFPAEPQGKPVLRGGRSPDLCNWVCPAEAEGRSAQSCRWRAQTPFPLDRPGSRGPERRLAEVTRNPCALAARRSGSCQSRPQACDPRPSTVQCPPPALRGFFDAGATPRTSPPRLQGPACLPPRPSHPRPAPPARCGPRGRAPACGGGGGTGRARGPPHFRRRGRGGDAARLLFSDEASAAASGCPGGEQGGGGGNLKRELGRDSKPVAISFAQIRTQRRPRAARRGQAVPRPRGRWGPGGFRGGRRPGRRRPARSGHTPTPGLGAERAAP